jgi:integrase
MNQRGNSDNDFAALDKLIEEITVDAYGDEEGFWAFRHAFEDNFTLPADGFVTLYTRKKKGGHLTPRRVPMTRKLHEILMRRYENRDPDKPRVFWHRYWSRKKGCFVTGPFGDRKKVMKRLCDKAGVRYFRFHPIRHYGASIMDGNGIPLGAIQRILGHENRKTTEIYLHSMGDSEKDAMRVFEQARQKIPHNPHTDDQPKQRG